MIRRIVLSIVALVVLLVAGLFWLLSQIPAEGSTVSALDLYFEDSSGDHYFVTNAPADVTADDAILNYHFITLGRTPLNARSRTSRSSTTWRPTPVYLTAKSP